MSTDVQPGTSVLVLVTPDQTSVLSTDVPRSAPLSSVVHHPPTGNHVATATHRASGLCSSIGTPTSARRSTMTNDLQTDPATTLSMVHDLSTEMVSELAEHIGDGDGVDALMREWLRALGPSRFGLVASYALRTVFAQCLTITSTSEIPAGSAVLAGTERNGD